MSFLIFLYILSTPSILNILIVLIILITLSTPSILIVLIVLITLSTPITPITPITPTCHISTYYSLCSAGIYRTHHKSSKHKNIFLYILCCQRNFSYLCNVKHYCRLRYGKR